MSEKKLAIIATKGILDWGYPPFILASPAAALVYEVEIFFTFYGLKLLEKNLPRFEAWQRIRLVIETQLLRAQALQIQCVFALRWRHRLHVANVLFEKVGDRLAR